MALLQFDILGVYFSCFNFEGVNVICIKDSVRRMSYDISLDVDVIIFFHRNDRNVLFELGYAYLNHRITLMGRL